MFSLPKHLLKLRQYFDFDYNLTKLSYDLSKLAKFNRTFCDETQQHPNINKHTNFNESNASDLYMNISGNIQVGMIGGGTVPFYASAMLKQYPFIKNIHLIDTKSTSHKVVDNVRFIDTSTQLHYHQLTELDDDQFKHLLRQLDIIAILDKDDFKFGHLSLQEQFSFSLSYIYETAKSIAITCPRALIAVFARPVTASLPLVYETFSHYGSCEVNKIVGSTALETMRIESATAKFLDLDPSCMSIPIAGGADAYSSVPLLSRAKRHFRMSDNEEKFILTNFACLDKDLCKHTSNGLPVSTGLSVTKFILALAAGLNGCDNILANAYVRSNVLPICHYFSSNVLFGINGIERVFNLPHVSTKELELIENSVEIINKYDKCTKAFVHKQFLKENECKLTICNA